MSGSEIELKLRLDKGGAAKLRRHPALRRYRLGRGHGATLDSTYFDTPDLALAARGWALRIRRDGDNLEQTLKIPKKGGGLQTRGEWNAPLTRDALDLSLIPEVEARNWLEARQAEQGLVPIFTTRFRRLSWMLAIGGADVELALDEGEILSDDKREPIQEAELELKQGDAGALIVLARELVESVPAHVDPRSKAERGYALFSGALPVSKRAGKLDLDRHAEAWDAFRAVMGNCLEQVLANDAPIRLARDMEGVHQMRVALRRLRAAISVFAPILEPDAADPIAEDLRELQQRFGPARDWDVFLDETLAPMLGRLGQGHGLAELKTAAEKAREKAYDTALDILQQPVLTDLVLRIEAWILRSTPPNAVGLSALEFARRTLRKRWRKVVKAAGGGPLTLSEPELHALRIEIKKLRYAGDFFRSLFQARRIDPILGHAAALQDCLGGLNDAVIAQSLMGTLPKVQPAKAAALAKEAQLLLAGWQEGRIARELPGLDAAWKNFVKARKPW